MTIAMSAMVAIVALLAIAVTSLGTIYAARHQATNAADAAALAAAVATYPAAAASLPTAAARAMARDNGATLTRCRCPVDPSLRVRVVEVTTAVPVDVPVFGTLLARAHSRAEFDPERWLAR